MVYHRILNIDLCAIQWDLVVYPFYILKAYICQSQPPPPWQPQVCSLCLWVCFVDKFICVIF